MRLKKNADELTAESGRQTGDARCDESDEEKEGLLDVSMVNGRVSNVQAMEERT